MVCKSHANYAFIKIYSVWLPVTDYLNFTQSIEDLILQQETPNYTIKNACFCICNAIICACCFFVVPQTSLHWFNDQYFTDLTATWQNTSICVFDYCTIFE